MKVVNDVRIGVGLEKKHLRKAGPTMPTGDYRVVRSRRSDRRDQFSLNAVPAITVLNHWLVNHFEKHELRISLRQMRRKSAPKLCKRFNATLVSIHAQLELITRMNIDDDRQTSAKNHVERAVNVLQVSGVEYRRIWRISEQRRGFDRKAHVVETHRLDERDVLRGGVRFETLFRVIWRLREPVTQVNSAAQTRESRRKIQRFF